MAPIPKTLLVGTISTVPKRFGISVFGFQFSILLDGLAGDVWWHSHRHRSFEKLRVDSHATPASFLLC